MAVSVLAFIFVFMIVALAHEIGHFVWAKRAGIRVLELGVGFGPTIYSFTNNKTKYSLNLVPFLAFVRLAGIDDESEDDKNIPLQEKYESKSPLQKFYSIVAGPTANIFLAFLVYSFLSMAVGLTWTSSEITNVIKGSPADIAGIKNGDIISSVNGKTFPDFVFVIDKIHKSSGKNLTLQIIRGGNTMLINATPEYNRDLKIGLLGFTPKQIHKKYTVFTGFTAGAEKTYSVVSSTIYILGMLFSGNVSIFDLAGPIGIAQLSGKAASLGLTTLMFFLAFISVNLGVVNLLPLPALDGGRIIFIIIEAVRGKPVDIHLENKIHGWGLSALLFLMLVISFNDILRIFSIKLFK